MSRGDGGASKRRAKSKGTWGGKRPGAGRKPKGERAQEPHRARPKHTKNRPVLVTLRASLSCLTSDDVLPTVHAALEGAARWDPEAFRIARSSVHADRVDLIVYASAKRTLSGGIRSVAIRIARSVNAVLGRSGRFWTDRWHGREITSSRELSQLPVKPFGPNGKVGTRPVA